jgi:DNA-binding NtrC family response regulator
VRELRNVVERVLLLSAAETVSAEEVNLALPVSRNGETTPSTGSGPLTQRIESFEREVLLAELRRHHHHMTNTARALGLERSHLYKKCQQLGIDLQTERKSE